MHNTIILFFFLVAAVVLVCVLMVSFVLFRRRQLSDKDYVKYIKLDIPGEGSKGDSSCHIEFCDDPDQSETAPLDQ